MIEQYLPQSRKNIFQLYEKTVARYMNSKTNQIIVDAGGGKFCSFVKYKNPGVNAKIIAVDMDKEVLKNNIDVDEVKISNIEKGLPFESEEVDLIVSRSVLEHLKSIDTFISNSKRVLKKQGYLIHLFPAKFAPFALINQLLPHSLSKQLINLIRPEYKGVLGYRAFYNNCYYSKIRSVLKKNNFEIIELNLSYYQTHYFNFCFPLYLLIAFYEIFLLTFRIKNLCAYILFVAKRK